MAQCGSRISSFFSGIDRGMGGRGGFTVVLIVLAGSGGVGAGVVWPSGFRVCCVCLVVGLVPVGGGAVCVWAGVGCVCGGGPAAVVWLGSGGML